MKKVMEELRIELSTSSSPTVFDSANDALYQVSYTPDLMVVPSELEVIYSIDLVIETNVRYNWAEKFPQMYRKGQKNPSVGATLSLSDLKTPAQCQRSRECFFVSAITNPRASCSPTLHPHTPTEDHLRTAYTMAGRDPRDRAPRVRNRAPAAVQVCAYPKRLQTNG